MAFAPDQITERADLSMVPAKVSRTATNALASHAFLHRRLFWSDAGNVLTVC
jgi:hypothetical protein